MTANDSEPSSNRPLEKTDAEPSDVSSETLNSSSFDSATRSKSSNSEKRRRVYSRRGDLGETSLCFGPRVGKDHLRVVVCGTLDELNSFLGLARSEGLATEIDAEVSAIQRKIFRVAGEITTLNPSRHETHMIQTSDVLDLESRIDAWDSRVSPLNQFLIPGGSKTAATLHVARSICRRAERRVVALLRKDETVSRLVVAWLNRLSDFLFVLARNENRLKNSAEIKWSDAPESD